MHIRYTDYINDENQLKNLLNEIIGCLSLRAKFTNSTELQSLWLANVCALLTSFKQFSGEECFCVLEESLKSFDLSDYRRIFNDAIVHLNHNFLHLSEEKIRPLIVPAILEYDSLVSSGICSQPSNLNLLINELSELYKCLLLHGNQPVITFQIFKKLFFFISAGALINLLQRKDEEYISSSFIKKIQYFLEEKRKGCK